jgi:lipopolysaccharide transport system ATP-binding protein
MSESAITVDKLCKRYIIGHRRSKDDGIRHVIEDVVRAPLQWFRGRGARAKARSEEFWAVRDVSFAVKRGEVLGVIGRNGAGKSTLLKLLSRITEPTSGRIEILGRVASLLEVGTGFHQELTGRENIFLNGAILGMSRVEIKRKFDEIVAFSEIENFLDTPVKRYSSGMYVRLAFSVAAHLDPDILIVDEVLAVGDAQFQKKCLGKIEGISKNSDRTVLFVSHSMAAVTRLCTQCVAMEAGKVVYCGDTAKAVARYNQYQSGPGATAAASISARQGSGEYRYTVAEATRDHYAVAEPKKIHFKIERQRTSDSRFFISGHFRQDDAHLFQYDGRMLDHWLPDQAEITGEITFKHPWIKPGKYQVDLYICTTSGIVDELLNGVTINIVEDLPYTGAYTTDAYRFGTVLADFAIDLS